MLDDLFILSRHLIRLLNRPYERYFIREVELKGRCSIIAGKRGVGKTTTLVQHLLRQDADIQSSTETLYVPVDHFAVRQTPLYEIARDFVQQGGKRLYVDEIHKYPAWSRDLKSIHDTFPGLAVVASGSSMMQIRQGSHDLSRRAVIHRMHGMSFREFMEMRFELALPILKLDELIARHEIIAPDLTATLEAAGTKPLAAFREYLQFGVYPYYFKYADRDLFRAALEQNMHTAIESDLPAVCPQLSGISNSRIKMLLAAIAASVPLTPGLATLRRLLDIADDRTLKTYLGGTNEAYALQPSGRADIGSIRETFFAQSVASVNALRVTEAGDSATDDGRVFEIGGRNKTAHQVRGKSRAFLALDDIETGIGARIPLWLFGFLY